MKLLREELDFNGLIVSDATSMIGMTSFGRRKDIIPQCIASGIDMFLFTNDMQEDFQAMLQGVHDGVLKEERLNEAVTRILALKASLGLHLTQMDERDLDVVGSTEHLQLAAEIASKSVTLVRGQRNRCCYFSSSEIARVHAEFHEALSEGNRRTLQMVPYTGPMIIGF